MYRHDASISPLGFTYRHKMSFQIPIVHFFIKIRILYFSRTLSMGLLVALDSDATASGHLFWDDGETLGT